MSNLIIFAIFYALIYALIKAIRQERDDGEYEDDDDYFFDS